MLYVMHSLFQEFEFTYADGELFYDRAGMLVRRLQSIYPDLQTKETKLTQRDFSSQAWNLQLFFGIAVSRLQAFSLDNAAFAEQASGFFQKITETFEISEVRSFYYRQIMGVPCSSYEQAQELMWPLIDETQKKRLLEAAPKAAWNSFSANCTIGNLDFDSEIKIMNLIPESGIRVGAHLADKMHQIIIPNVDVKNASLEEVMEYLRLKSIELDPAGSGVRLALSDQLPAFTAALSLDLKNIPLWEAVRHLCELTGLHSKLTPDRVLLCSPSEGAELPYVTFHLQVDGRLPISAAEFDPAAFINNVRENQSRDLLSKLAPHLAP
jgi:hypothetical protein